MSCNIVFIGGGSFLWTPRLATDLFLKSSLRGSRLTLVDIDPEAATLIRDYCRSVNQLTEADWTIDIDDLDPALADADYVIVSISTGGLEAFDKDYHIPEKYGVFHSVADTVGPGGISRTLRNVPVFLDIAHRMERLCPQAWMIHVTNPLAQLTRCVCKETSVKTVGLCHNFEGTMGAMAKYLGVERSAVDADTFGVNHFTWLRNPTCNGKRFDDQLTLEKYFEHEATKTKNKDVATNTTDDDVDAMTEHEVQDDERLTHGLFERFGYFPVGGAPHVAENFPWYLNDLKTIRKHHIRRKGVLPRRQEGKDEKRQRIEDVLAGQREHDPIRASHESLSDIVESLHTGVPCRAVVNLPNQGQIENLPRDVVVETWAAVARDSITPMLAGPIPTALKGFMEAIVAEEELTVNAALTGDRDAVVQAMTVSPLLQNKDAAEQLTDELLLAQKDYLPQFDKG